MVRGTYDDLKHCCEVNEEGSVNSDLIFEEFEWNVKYCGKKLTEIIQKYE